MKNRYFKYILSVMLTSVLLLVGCGSSSNPSSSGNVSSGLVSVSGNVKNLNGNGSVSFYTPTAAVKSGMNVTSNFRASISNEGIYTFNTDENGNYSGQIPEGDYYVIAQNSDGTMKSVSEKQTFRASETATDDPYDIKLTKTVNISGKVNIGFENISSNDLSSSSSSEEPVASIAVYIEKMPFIAVTDSNGAFTFNSVPIITDDSKYIIQSTVSMDGFVLTASKELTKDSFGDGSSDVSNANITFTKNELLTNINVIQGYVYQDQNKTPRNKQLVVALLGSGQILSTVTDSDGLFVFVVNKNESSAQLTINMTDYKNAEITSWGSTEFNNTFILNMNPSSPKNGILINEETDGNSSGNGFEDGFYFAKNCDATLTLFKKSGSIEEYSSEKVYIPLASYTINNLDNGTYCYMLATHNYEYNCYGLRFSEDISVNDSLEKATCKYYACFNAPTIVISDNHEYVVSSNSISETDLGSIVTIATYAYAINKNIPETEIPLSVEETTSKIVLDELNSGVYSIFGGYSIKYNGCSVATITSDPYSYVKH